MACTNCTQTTATITGFIPADCASINPCFLDAGCVYYTGPNLACSGIATNTALDVILQTIDPLLCAATGDYSTYNTYCLAPITTQKQFVESISNYVCTLNTTVTTFIGTTFPAYQATVNSRFVALELPGITCSSASVINTDTLQQVLNKYCTKFGSIDTLLNVSSANWNSCYVVSPLPTSPVEGFNTLISEICILKSQIAGGGGSLPTFNNVGSCLPAPVTSADTLVDTVNKIKTRLCQTGTLDTTTLTFGCVSNTVSGGQDLQGTLQNILTKVTAISQSLPTQWSADFTVTNVDNTNLCLGKNIDLAPLVITDRFVASSPSDMSPGTLQQKMIPGTNVTFDFVTSPGFMIVNSTGGSGVGDHKVAVDSSDSNPDYLGAKLTAGGVTKGLQVYPSVDTVNGLVNLNINVNIASLFQGILDELSVNSSLFTSLCTLIAQCPSPCAAPSNVTVIYSGGTTSTTTTTTTT